MKVGALTDKGLVRDVNEDCYSVITDAQGIPYALIIADGMGGHNAGEIASSLAVSFIENALKEMKEFPTSEEDVMAYIKSVVTDANAHVYSQSLQKADSYGMGTTLILVLIRGDKLFIGHVGDSRAYVIHEGKILRMTTDHSFIEELVKNGSLTREEAQFHPKKNIITRALGCADDLEVDTVAYELADGDSVVLCTDGLTNLVPENEIAARVQEKEDPQEACEGLVALANSNGGEDNITIIILKGWIVGRK